MHSAWFLEVAKCHNDYNLEMGRYIDVSYRNTQNSETVIQASIQFLIYRYIIYRNISSVLTNITVVCYTILKCRCSTV